jgi:selenocysteine lyase/cysteine desulfurase
VELGAELRSTHESENRSAIVSFAFADNPAEAIVERLEQRDIVARVRAGAVRLSPHAYNTDDEIDRVLDEVAQLR